MTTLSRRAFLRGAPVVASAAVVGASTPMWARWLSDEMRRLLWKPETVTLESSVVALVFSVTINGVTYSNLDGQIIRTRADLIASGKGFGV